MTLTNSGRQQILLRPLFSRPVHEVHSPIGDDSRRVSLPTQLPLHRKSGTYNGHIKKHEHDAKTRKHRGRASPDLDQQFADGIEATHKEIRKAADAVLTQVEGDASVELAQVVEDFEEKLQFALGYETRAFQSIADERLLITRLSREKQPVEKEEVIFGDRMHTFQQIVDEEEKALETLWREWKEIQIELVCLAFEVLGPDEVVTEEEQPSVIMPEKVNAAIHCYAQHQDILEGRLNKMVAIQTAVKKVTSRTLRTLKDQQEELSAAKEVAMNNVTKMLEDLDA